MTVQANGTGDRRAADGLTVGLTGGIGAGKSEVIRLLAEHGAVVIDADAVAREVVAPGTPGLEAVVREFGADVLQPDGTLDRPKLGRIVFADPERLAVLNSIVHPLVGARIVELVEKVPAGSVLVHDVPLLVENGLAGAYDVVVVVDASEQTRARRLRESRGMTDAEIEDRMAAQAPRAERLAAADIVIANEGTKQELAARVDALWEELLDKHQPDAGRAPEAR